MTRIIFDYNFADLKEILTLADGGIDFRFSNYPHEDLSVETVRWNNVQDFLEWYKNQIEEAEKEEEMK